jgi:hypothetical protein
MRPKASLRNKPKNSSKILNGRNRHFERPPTPSTYVGIVVSRVLRFYKPRAFLAGLMTKVFACLMLKFQDEHRNPFPE